MKPIFCSLHLPPIFERRRERKSGALSRRGGGGHANTWGMLSNGGSFIESTDKIVSYGITPQVVHLNFLRVSYGASSLPKCQLLDQNFTSLRESGSSGCSAEVSYHIAAVSQPDSAEAILSDIVHNQSACSATAMHSSHQPDPESTSPQTSLLSALHSDSESGLGQNEGGDRAGGLKMLCAK
jgi:hypothetical protein